MNSSTLKRADGSKWSITPRRTLGDSLFSASPRCERLPRRLTRPRGWGGPGLSPQPVPLPVRLDRGRPVLCALGLLDHIDHHHERSLAWILSKFLHASRPSYLADLLSDPVHLGTNKWLVERTSANGRPDLRHYSHAEHSFVLARVHASLPPSLRSLVGPGP